MTDFSQISDPRSYYFYLLGGRQKIFEFVTTEVEGDHDPEDPYYYNEQYVDSYEDYRQTQEQVIYNLSPLQVIDGS